MNWVHRPGYTLLCTDKSCTYLARLRMTSSCLIGCGLCHLPTFLWLGNPSSSHSSSKNLLAIIISLFQMNWSGAYPIPSNSLGILVGVALNLGTNDISFLSYRIGFILETCQHLPLSFLGFSRTCGGSYGCGSAGTLPSTMPSFLIIWK